MALALAMEVKNPNPHAFMENGTKHIDTMPLFRGWEMARVGIYRNARQTASPCWVPSPHNNKDTDPRMIRRPVHI